MDHDMDYRAELVDALKEDWYDLMHEGDEIELDDGTSLETVYSEEISRGRWETHCRVVTLLPDGRYFRWEYSLGNTEMQENTGPGEYGEPELTEVLRHEAVVTTVHWSPAL